MRILIVSSKVFDPTIDCTILFADAIWMVGHFHLSSHFSRYVRKCTSVPLFVKGGVNPLAVEHINSIVQEQAIEAILPCGLKAGYFLQEISSYLTDVLVFPMSSALISNRLDDKWSFANLCQSIEVPIPKTLLVESADDAQNLSAQGMDYPVLFKPLAETASRGICLFNEAQEAVDYIKGDFRYNGLPLVAQEFIKGKDFCLNVLCRDGEILTAFAQSQEANGIFRFMEFQEAEDMASRILREVCYSGIANFCMRVEDKTGRLLFFECNPRSWGSMRFSAWAGFNFVEEGFRAAKGEKVRRHPFSSSGVAISTRGYFIHKVLFHPLPEGLSDINFQGIYKSLCDPIVFLTRIFATLRKFMYKIWRRKWTPVFRPNARPNKGLAYVRDSK